MKTPEERNMNHLEYINCPTCGLTLKEIREEHKVGCQNCLVVFRDAIEQILVEKMGNITYGGQYVPHQIFKKDIKNNELNTDSTFDPYTNSKESYTKVSTTKKEKSSSLEELKKLLEKSVAAEDYEAAIYFRNEIKRLEKA